MAPPRTRARRVAARAGVTLIVVALLTSAATAQQPNGGSALYVQFRQGPPYPIIANAPNAGSLTLTLTGTPGAAYVLATGPVHPGTAIFPGGQSVDIGTPPFFQDVTIIADGTAPGGSAYQIPQSGIALITSVVPPNAAVPVPPLQAAVVDLTVPGGFALTATSAITFLPSKSILFIQGDWDPGTGPKCRLADTSPFGFSMLEALLYGLGFNSVTEVDENTIVLTPQFLAPYGIIVLGSNRRAYATAEVDALEAFVRAGGGLVSYADSTFGPGNTSSDSQFLTRFGLLVCPDNIGGPVVASSFVAHPITAGVTSVGAEGVSLIEIVGNGVDVITDVCPCSSNWGACHPYPLMAPSGSANPTYTACAAVSAGSGRVVAVFDRNTFFNPPGYGSSILSDSNLSYALNLFLWAGGY